MLMQIVLVIKCYQLLDFLKFRVSSEAPAPRDTGDNAYLIVLPHWCFIPLQVAYILTVQEHVDIGSDMISLIIDIQSYGRELINQQREYGSDVLAI